jgi:HicB-like protein involved in pilus formation
MDLTPYVDSVRRELAVAAEAGGDEARALAERLSAPLASAIRLTLLDALSVAADEITRDLAPGSVEVRLRQGDPNFAVTAPAVEPPVSVDRDGLQPEPDVAPTEEPSTAALSDEDGAMTRINFRLPEHLKARIEEAAARQGRSVNAWLVRAATAALRPQSAAAAPQRGSRSSQHFTGWVS